MVRGRRALGVLLATAALLAGAAVPALAAPAGPTAQASAATPAAPAPATRAAATRAPAVTIPAPPEPGCAQPPADLEGYAPSTRCELLLVRAEAVCVGAAPVLDYAVEAVGTDASSVTLTWVNPAGDDLVQTGLPLSGRVYWPGTVVEDGDVVDWPGWTQDDAGTWVEHDAYSFTRPQVGLVLEVNPSVSTVVAYPPEGSACWGPTARRVADVPATPGVPATSGVPTTTGVLAAPAVTVPAAPAPARAASAVLAVTGVSALPQLVGAGLLVLLGLVLVGLAARRRRHAG